MTLEIKYLVFLDNSGLPLLELSFTESFTTDAMLVSAVLTSLYSYARQLDKKGELKEIELENDELRIFTSENVLLAVLMKKDAPIQNSYFEEILKDFSEHFTALNQNGMIDTTELNEFKFSLKKKLIYDMLHPYFIPKHTGQLVSGFSAQELQILSVIDGFRTVQEIIQLTQQPEATVKETLSTLYAKNIITMSTMISPWDVFKAINTATALSTCNIELDQESQEILSMLDGYKTLHEVSKIIGKNIEIVSETTEFLVRQGLAQKITVHEYWILVLATLVDNMKTITENIFGHERATKLLEVLIKESLMEALKLQEIKEEQEIKDITTWSWNLLSENTNFYIEVVQIMNIFAKKMLEIFKKALSEEQTEQIKDIILKTLQAKFGPFFQKYELFS